CQVCLGLHYLHGRSILHRDLKPANLFLNEHKSLVLIGDFGLAKVMVEDDHAKAEVGTPYYTSPEMVSSK
ncbi:unnamed protein product, partial [Chrysoparadoxa australica]